MITRITVVDGLEHTLIGPIVKQVVHDINSKIIKDPDPYYYYKINYENENAGFTDYNYDNTLGGPTIDISYEIEENEELKPGTSTYIPLNKPIIIDKDNGFTVYPRLYYST